MPQFTRDELATLRHYVKAHIEHLHDPPYSPSEIHELVPLFYKLKKLLEDEGMSDATP